VQSVDLQRMLNGSWFIRLVLIVWIVCAASLVVLLKNMESIVHVQLYEYGLVVSPDWLGPYQLFSSLIYYFCLLPPLILSGFALISTFIREPDKASKRINTAPHGPKPPQVTKVQSPPLVREVMPKKVENTNNNGISCPNCKKTFGRALVMLDFRSGRNELVSVCPYCNHVLVCSSEGKGPNYEAYMASLDKEITR